MATVRAFGLGLVAAVAMLVGCADASSAPLGMDEEGATKGGPTTFMPNAVNADQHFADTAAFTGTSVTVPTAGNEALLGKIEVGTVIASNRSKAPVAGDAESPNPYGFIAKVLAIRTDGDKTVLTTEQATLADWIRDGDIDFTDPKSLLDGTVATPLIDPASVKTETLHLQDDHEDTSAQARAVKHPNVEIEDELVKVSFSDVNFDLRTKFDGGASLHHKSVWGVDLPLITGAKVRMHMVLDPTVRATVKVKASRSFGLKKLSKDVPLGKIMFDVGPVPITLEASVGYECGISATGPVTLTATTTLALHTEVGFEASAGMTDLPDANNLSKRPTLTPDIRFDGITEGESLAATCTAYLKGSVHVFDAVGIEAKVGPEISLIGEACAKGSAVSARFGFAGGVAASIRFPWIHFAKVEQPLLDISTDFTDPKYIWGSAATCNKDSKTVKEVDSCAGKADKFYCSEILDYAGYYCAGGQIAQGRQCDMDQKCAGGDEDRILCK